MKVLYSTNRNKINIFIHRYFKSFSYVFLLYLVLFTLLLLFSSFFPITFDDSYFMIVSRNLAQKGQYATDYVLFDPYITTGFTVIAPIALVFKLFSVGAMQGRIVSILYLLGFLTTLYLLPQHLGILTKRRSLLVPGIVIILALFTVPNFLLISFNTFGDIPSLFFYLMSLVLLFYFFRTKSLSTLFLTGILIGLSFSTKYIMVFCVISTLLSFVYAQIVNKDKKSAKNLFILITGIAIPELIFRLYHFATVGPTRFFKDINYVLTVYKSLNKLTFVNHDTGSNLINHLSKLQEYNLNSLSLLLVLIMVFFALFYFARKKNYILMNMSIFVGLTYFWWFFISPNALIRHLSVAIIVADTLFTIIIIKLIKTLLEPTGRKLSTFLLLILTIEIVFASTSSTVFLKYNISINTYINERNEQVDASEFIRHNAGNYYFSNKIYSIIPQLAFLADKKFKYFSGIAMLEKNSNNYLVLNRNGKCNQNRTVLKTNTYTFCKL